MCDEMVDLRAGLAGFTMTNIFKRDQDTTIHLPELLTEKKNEIKNSGSEERYYSKKGPVESKPERGRHQ